MKTFIRNYFCLLACSGIIALASCQSNNTENKEQPKDTSPQPTSDLMKEGPAYDATKINPSAPVSEIKLKTLGNTMAEMKYDQVELHVKAGSTVKLKLENSAKDAAMQHNFALIEKGSAPKVGPEALKAGPSANYIPKMREVLVSTSIVGPGQSTEITFPAPEKGEYDFICTYPGHYTMMKGKLFVD